MELDLSLFNTQHYKLRIKSKWSNPGKGIAPSLTPRCSSCCKESLRVAVEYSQPTNNKCLLSRYQLSINISAVVILFFYHHTITTRINLSIYLWVCSNHTIRDICVCVSSCLLTKSIYLSIYLSISISLSSYLILSS